MTYTPPFKKISVVPFIGAALSMLAAPAFAQQSGSLAQAFKDGKVDVDFRLRYENVDDGNPAMKDTAEGLTLRSELGYTTGSFQALSVRLAAQDVRAILDNFNDATGRAGVKTTRPTIADPSATSLLEGYVSYNGVSNTIVKVGRQLIEFGPTPLNRYVGSVPWRQNWQSFDAVSLQNKSLKDLTVSYAYVWRVQRIFSDKAVGALSEFASDSHLLNMAYNKFPFAKLEAYYYELNFANATTSSVATYGAKVSGDRAVSERVKLRYGIEYAEQSDYGPNPLNDKESYFSTEIGLGWTSPNPSNGLLRGLGIRINYERLDGNGTMAFQTPLATLHAYQGWADKFTTTPKDGINDLQLTIDSNLAGNKLALVWHDFSSANANYDYGQEIDAQATRVFNQNWTGGLKIARFNANVNATNFARNGLALTRNIYKFWAWVEFKY